MGNPSLTTETRRHGEKKDYSSNAETEKNRGHLKAAFTGRLVSKI